MDLKAYSRVFTHLLRGEPRKARSLALKRYYRILKRYYHRRHPGAMKLVDESWDVLIVLDACRFDYFENLYGRFLEGTLEKRISLGTSTSEWLVKNFSDNHEDIVYVSANPHCSDHEIHGYKGSDHFHQVEHVWKHAWDDELNTVLPQTVAEAGSRAANFYVDKRVIIHFLQPHIPWIGSMREEAGLLEQKAKNPREDGNWDLSNLIELIMQGRFSRSFLERACRENLELVLECVRDLVDQLSGRIVVTADHGECWGEKLIYGHLPGIYVRELLEVPWFVIDKGPRRSLRTSEHDNEDPKEDVETADEIVQERLRALGYLD